MTDQAPAHPELDAIQSQLDAKDDVITVLQSRYNETHQRALDLEVRAVRAERQLTRALETIDELRTALALPTEEKNND